MMVMTSKLITRDDIDTMDRAEYHRRQNEQYVVFERLCDLVETVLERFGRPDYLPDQPYGDFQVHCDYRDYPQVVVFVDNLKILLPPVVDALQQLVKEYPGWQIDLRITTRGHEDWPSMGSSIRADEIVDDLRREYFPKEYQNLAYEGARRGSMFD